MGRGKARDWDDGESDDAWLSPAAGDDDDDGELLARGVPRRKGKHDRRPDSAQRREREGSPAPARRGPSRAVRAGAEAFKCWHCRAFIGPTLTGGRHRNHCPLCLYSRHVDGARPGDRASTCGSLMAPIGRFERPNGEPMLVHHCLGCGFERNNRLAADDNWPLFEELPPVTPAARAAQEDDAGEE